MDTKIADGITIRSPQEDEFEKALKFLSHYLRPTHSWTIEEEYPLALNPGNRDNLFLATSGETIASMAALKTSLVKSPAGLFKIGAIGSVVTAPEFRNQGLSQRVLEHTLAQARAQVCDIAILWSDLHDFYRRLGFEPAGREVNLTLERGHFKLATPDLRIHRGANVEAEAILRLYNQHTTGCLRSAEDVRRSLKIPQTDVFTAWDKTGSLKAYAAVGKGADLTSHAHEWGGSVSSLLSLFSHMLEHSYERLHVMAPIHAANLIRQLVERGAGQSDGYLGLIKIINFELFFAKIRRYLRSMGHADLALDRRGGQFVFGREGDLYQTDSEADLVKLIFGPERSSQWAPISTDLRRTLDQVFPIPFWVWGWDSV